MMNQHTTTWISGDSSGNLTFAADVTVGDDLNLTTDASVINFGADSDVVLTHVADTGLILKHTATADDKPVSLTLQTGETDIAANDVIGKIDFQAPDEGTGTDAILVAAGIAAVSEGNFAADNNATSLQLKTGASEAATTKVTIKSDGKVGIGTTTPGHDLNVVSSGNAEFELERISGAALMFKTQSNLGVIGTTSNHPIQLMTNSAGRVTIDTNGVMTLGSGDLELQHDGSFISFGANDDVKLTHIHDTGLLLNTASVIQFRDSAINIGSPADGDLDINADDEVEINSTLIDVNGNLDVSGTLAQAGVATFALAANVAQVAITSSSNAIAWDASAAANAYHITTENTTFSAPSNAVEGAFIAVEINYNGSHTIAFNTIFEFAASTAPTTTDTDGKTDILVFRYNGAVWQEVGRTLNLSES